MRAVVTRVHHASVTIDGQVNGQIGQGFLVLLGINTRSTEDGFAICRLEVRIRDGVQLQAVMNKLNQISGVYQVTRPAG